MFDSQEEQSDGMPGDACTDDGYCVEDDLTGCEAGEGSVETCNGLDDDCDGAVLGPLDGTAGLEIPVEVKLQAGVTGAEMVSGGEAAIPLGNGNFNFTIHKSAQ